MNSILAVERGLPPGLWLPTPEESTEQYLRENFDHRDHDYADIVDYGAFIVAMALMECDNTGRRSMMPNTPDVLDLYESGYGISPRVLYEYYGGMKKLQLELGFYPLDYRPERSEMLKRFQWMADYAYPRKQADNDDGSTDAINDIIEWGSVRRLSPSSGIVYRIMKGDTTEIRRMFNIEIRGAEQQSSDMELYRFGAEVIAEHGRLLDRDELDDLYRDRFTHLLSNMIKARFGTYRNFWSEFGYANDAHGYEKDDYLLFGLRWAIAHGRTAIRGEELNRLSGERKFISRLPMTKYFGGIKDYFDEVEEAYGDYLIKREAYAAQGISQKVFQLFCRNYEQTNEFDEWLVSSTDIMLRLSSNTKASQYVLSIMRLGFNLLDEQIFEMQLEDFENCLKDLKIKNEADRRLVYSMVPRFSVQEMLA